MPCLAAPADIETSSPNGTPLKPRPWWPTWQSPSAWVLTSPCMRIHNVSAECSWSCSKSARSGSVAKVPALVISCRDTGWVLVGSTEVIGLEQAMTRPWLTAAMPSSTFAGVIRFSVPRSLSHRCQLPVCPGQASS